MTGESYGGHYVPAVSYAIFLQNKLEGSFKFNLQGLVRSRCLQDCFQLTIVCWLICDLLCRLLETVWPASAPA